MRALSRHWPLIALLLSAAALAVAHAFQTFGHLAPCTLCLKQREVYWIALGLAGLGVAAGFTPWKARGTRIACVGLGVIFLYGAGLAAWHAGVEWKWWPGPAACSGRGQVSSADLAALIHGAKMSIPACDKPAWVFLGLSMAGWNALLSLGLGVLSVIAAARKPAP
ncbi:MAG TPA: disulfide bond formation protein B [Caulobacteraceae bacterium]